MVFVHSEFCARERCPDWRLQWSETSACLQSRASGRGSSLFTAHQLTWKDSTSIGDRSSGSMGKQSLAFQLSLPAKAAMRREWIPVPAKGPKAQIYTTLMWEGIWIGTDSWSMTGLTQNPRTRLSSLPSLDPNIARAHWEIRIIFLWDILKSNHFYPEISWNLFKMKNQKLKNWRFLKAVFSKNDWFPKMKKKITIFF